uniref:Vitamin K epoxide reductase n=1 Tax=mine drainage metagenome TaxID=410659 RepID=E6PXU7_9ZZZZ
MDSKQEVIIITGGTGFIGSALINRFADRFALVGLDRMASHSPPSAAECVCIDLTSENGVKGAFERVRYAYGDRIASVIHLAAYYDFSGEPSPKYDEVTVCGTERLLRHLQEFHVEQFAFSSTMLVHAPTEPGRRINEDWPLEPKWDYPKSKVKTEQIIREQHGQIPIVLLRIAGVYNDRCHSIPLAQQIQRIYERQLVSHVFPGDMSHGQSFLHLDDLMDAVVPMVELRKTLPPELTLLLGEPDTLSYQELQRQFGRLIHAEDWQTREIPKELAKAGAWMENHIPFEDEQFIKPWMIDLADDHFELDISRARNLLDWETKHSLKDTLPKMVAALKADPIRWYHENKLKPPASLEETTAQPSRENSSED